MISGYPLWVVLLIGLGVFCASFVDAIGGGGGIISVPVYLLAGLPVETGVLYYYDLLSQELESIPLT